MSTIQTGWLKSKNGERFAPKTLVSQVQTSDGVLLEDKINEDLNSKADKNHTHSEYALKSDIANIDLSDYETKSDASSKLSEAKSYADSAASTVKNDLLNGAGAAYDTLKELGDLINENNNALDALETVASGKADKDHTHDDYALKTDVENINTVKDWNQNDETASDYIENRPFYTGEDIFELVNSGNFTTTNTSRNADAFLKEGVTYKVIWDGQEYTCICENIDEMLQLGNVTIKGEVVDNTKEPFLFRDVEGMMTFVFFLESGTHSYEVYEKAKEIHMLDRKYIDYVAGEKVTGKLVDYKGNETPCERGAEVFNDYVDNKAIGIYSHAEGSQNTAYGWYSHAENLQNKALGYASHAEGIITTAGSEGQHVQGRYNIVDYDEKYAHIVGNGERTWDENWNEVPVYSNAHTLDWEGNAEFQGDVKANACGGENPISLVEVATKVDNLESTKPDFNQNDPTADDYIKNRTHWTEYEREELLTDIVMTYEEGNEPAYETDVVLVEGEEYIVTFEGTEYVCKAKTQSPQEGVNITYIGNTMMTGGTDTGEPFAIATADIQPGVMAIVWDATVTNPATFSLTHLAVKEVHKLDSRYIDTPNWNAKEGEAGHILNRTHYAFNNYILPLTTFEVDGDQVQLQTTFNFEEGKTYFVNLNGVEYECIGTHMALDGMEMTYIGDITMSNPPFVIGDIPEGAGADFKSMINIGDGSEQITISVYTSDFKKLDNKFLDLDWIPTYVDEEEIIFQTTVDKSEGAWVKGLTNDIVTLGEKYVIDVLGTKYTCELKRVEDEEAAFNYFGNLYWFIQQEDINIDIDVEDTGEPFFIMIVEGELTAITDAIFGCDSDENIITFSIAEINKVPNKLPNEYLDMDWYASDVVKEEEIFSGAITNALQIGLTPDMIEVGGTYTVCINGKQYETVAKSCEYYDGSTFAVTYLGNGAILNNLEGEGLGATTEQADTGESYCVMISENMSSLIMNYEAVDSVVLSISKITKSINKLPNRYLDLDWLPIMKPEEVVFIEEFITTNSGLTNISNLKISNIAIGETLIIYYNGERYECVVRGSNDSNGNTGGYCGNGSKISGGIFAESNLPNTGEPFVFVITEASSVILADHNIPVSIYRLSDNLVPNKIPVEFLPDDIGGSSGNTVFYATVTANEDGTFSADKTFAEINEAYKAGMSVYCKIVTGTSCSILPLADVRDDSCSFLQTGELVCSITINNDNSVSINMVNLALAEDVPTTTSALTNDSGFITKAVNNLANYYLKSETYSQSEVNSLLSSIPKFTISVVSSLPTSNISDTTVYLVSSGEETDNLYTEYIYINNKWEILGIQKMDLSGYTLKTDFNTHATSNHVQNLVDGLKNDSLRSTGATEENDTYKLGFYAVAIGSETKASGNASFASGLNTTASGEASHAEGYNTYAIGSHSHAEGNSIREAYTITSEDFSDITEDITIEGLTAYGKYSHAEGNGTLAYGQSSHVEGNFSEAYGNHSHAEGFNTKASGVSSHSEGDATKALGKSSHAEGIYGTASGDYSHAEGRQTTASGEISHAEGRITEASGNVSHAEGDNTKASGNYSHAEGYITRAEGEASHAEGHSSIAEGVGSHAEGKDTRAKGYASHAEGNYTICNGNYSHVQGKYNIEDTNNIYAHIVGNGDDSARSNAHTLDWQGNAWFAGDVYVGSTSGVDKDAGSKKLVAAPTNVTTSSILMFNGTDWVGITKEDLIAEIIAAIPSAEGGSF